MSTEERSKRLSTKIFQKGLSLFESGKVSPDGESDRNAYFIVAGEHEPHRVRISSDGTFNCTCMRGTLHGATKGSVCSHVVAAIIFLAERTKGDRKG